MNQGQYRPGLDELRRARARLVEARLAEDWLADKPLAERRAAWGYVLDCAGASGWPQHAHPDDVRKWPFDFRLDPKPLHEDL